MSMKNSSNISFGGLFQGIGDLIDLVSKMAKEDKEEAKREGEFTSPSGKVKGIWGFTIKTGIGGKPTVEPFGNVRKTPKGPVVEEQREPIVDVFDEKDQIMVVAELPGIDKEDITTEIKNDILTLSAKNNNRKYNKEILLPCEVDPNTLTITYKNGILEIKMQKVKK